FLNITFKDEEDLSYINATIPTSRFTYWLGTGTVNKTLTYSSTALDYDYAFCSNAGQSLNVLPYVQYKHGTDYPQRIWAPSTQTYNSTLTEKTLYLLSSVDGIYVTYQVLDSVGNQLQGVEVTATRTIEGETFIIGIGETDAAGAVTFWMNPDFVHTITFSKSGYATSSVSQFPTQTTYTVTLGSSSTSGINDYIRGITYQIKPNPGITLNASQLYNFNMTFNSTYWNVSTWGFVMYGDNVVIGGNSSTGNSGFIYNTLNISDYNHVGMKVYWIINGTETSGTNNGWFVFDYTKGTDWSIWAFFKDLKNYSDDGIFGLNQASLNFILFLIIFITVGMTSYKFSIQSPSAILGLIFAMVFLFDVALGLINIPELENMVDGFPTIITGILLVASVIWEIRR
ncbi:MAG: hypothetical protein ACTSXD_14485, partial [Candidatus Heimdallarchaeaceae archaeon]